MLLSTAINSSELQEFRAASLRMGYQDVALPERVAEGIGCFSKHLFSALANDRIQSSDEPQTLVIIGGDTLGAVAEANQWPGFIARDEILPGAALCAIVNHPNFLLITKPGGFGDANLLVDLASKATFGSPK